MSVCACVYACVRACVCELLGLFAFKVLDPQHIEELHNYLQMVDEEIKTDDDDDDDEEEEEEEESVNSSSNDVSDSSSDDDNETKSDMEFKVDEEFRKEIKMALGDAALPSSEVCNH